MSEVTTETKAKRVLMQAPAEKVKLTIAQIKADLDAGLERYSKDPNEMTIAKKYGLNRANVTALFNRPELKGLKTKGKKRVGAKGTNIWFEIEGENGEAEKVSEQSITAAVVNDGTIKDAVKESAGSKW